MSSEAFWPDALPPIVDAFQLSKDTTPLPPVLVEGLLHQASKMVLGGGSKSYKTWALLDLGLSVSHGLPWMGRECQQGKVVFLNFEIQEGFMRERLKSVAKAKGVEIATDSLKFWNLRGKAAGHEEILPKITDQIREEKYSLIVLDPLYKLMGAADENSATDIADLLNGIERLAVDSGAAVAFGAHFSKGSQAKKESIDRISGSGVFARDPDAIITLTAHEESQAYTVEATLRNFPPVQPFVIQWDYPIFHSSTLDPTKLKGGSKRAIYSVQDLLDCFQDGMTNKEWEVATEESSGMKHGTFYKYLKKVPPEFAIKEGKKWKKNATGPFSPFSADGPLD